MPLSRLAGGEALSPHSTPRDAEQSVNHATAQPFLRQSAPGRVRDAEEPAAGSHHAGGRRLLRGMQERSADGGGRAGEPSLASRSVDARSGRGGSVFAQQLAAMRSSTPGGLQLEDARCSSRCYGCMQALWCRIVLP
jgi:hypothetical protein